MFRGILSRATTAATVLILISPFAHSQSATSGMFDPQVEGPQLLADSGPHETPSRAHSWQSFASVEETELSVFASSHPKQLTESSSRQSDEVFALVVYPRDLETLEVEDAYVSFDMGGELDIDYDHKVSFTTCSRNIIRNFQLYAGHEDDSDVGRHLYPEFRSSNGRNLDSELIRSIKACAKMTVSSKMANGDEIVDEYNLTGSFNIVSFTERAVKAVGEAYRSKQTIEIGLD
ncbi:MAG: hypothetical protein HRT45_04455 [Bdellovibrionales bacterium]|nr:hypothetical protein [Bdellovibrionales bacterium]